MALLATEIPGWMTIDELEWLRDTAAHMESVLEIGSWLGRSTSALCESGCKEVWTVDDFRGFADVNNKDQLIVPAKVEPFTQFFRTVGKFRNLHIIPVSSEEAARTLIGDFDFIFIDGEHSYSQICMDIKLWQPRARKMLAGHDIILPSVRKAVQELLPKGFINPVSTIWQELRR